MILFEDYNFAFLHINKTGGTAVTIFLEEVLTGPREEVGGRRPDGHVRVHEPLSYKKEKLSTRFNSLKFLTTIRNPYERWLSLYTASVRNVKEKRKKPGNWGILATQLPFDVWLSEHVLWSGPLQSLPQQEFLFVTDRYVLDSFIPDNLSIIRLEDIDNELPIFLKDELGVETNLEILKKNISNHMREKDKDTIDYYPDYLRKIVYDLDKYIIDKYYPEFKY